MDTGNYITIGIMLIGFVANAAYLKGAFSTQIQNNRDDIRQLEDNVQYKDTCTGLFSGVCTRVTRLESLANGKLKG